MIPQPGVPRLRPPRSGHTLCGSQFDSSQCHSSPQRRRSLLISSTTTQIGVPAVPAINFNRPSNALALSNELAGDRYHIPGSFPVGLDIPEITYRGIDSHREPPSLSVSRHGSLHNPPRLSTPPPAHTRARYIRRASLSLNHSSPRRNPGQRHSRNAAAADANTTNHPTSEVPRPVRAPQQTSAALPFRVKILVDI